MVDFLFILLMVIPLLLAVIGIGFVVIPKANNFFIGAKLYAFAAVTQVFYAFMISIPLEWEWHRLSTALMFAASAYMWASFGGRAKRAEIAEAEREQRYQAEETKRLANNLGLAWADVLTYEQEQAKILVELEKTYQEGKQHGS